MTTIITRKLLLACLAVVFVLAITACGGGSDGGAMKRMMMDGQPTNDGGGDDGGDDGDMGDGGDGGDGGDDGDDGDDSGDMDDGDNGDDGDMDDGDNGDDGDMDDGDDGDDMGDPVAELVPTATVVDVYVSGMLAGERETSISISTSTEEAGAGPAVFAQVTAVASDNEGGFYVTYRIDGVDRRVHLAMNPDGYYSNEDKPGDLYQLTDFASYNHFDVKAWDVLLGERIFYSVNRGYVVHGVPTVDLPAGTASYAGEVWKRNSHPAVSTLGKLNLTADFDRSTVAGTLYDFRDNVLDIPLNTPILIENGAITDSRFTADLTGQGSYSGFEGDMAGQFFGPSAAEVGGVLKGTNTEDDTVVWGWFGGTKQ